jgi:hypothetical protein
MGIAPANQYSWKCIDMNAAPPASAQMKVSAATGTVAIV